MPTINGGVGGAVETDIVLVLNPDRLTFGDFVNLIAKLVENVHEFQIVNDKYTLSFIPLLRDGNLQWKTGRGDGTKARRYSNRLSDGGKYWGPTEELRDRGKYWELTEKPEIGRFEYLWMSPFGDYETWVEKSVHVRYTAQCGEYPRPAPEIVNKVVKDMRTKLGERLVGIDTSKFYSGSVISNTVTNQRMVDQRENDKKERKANTTEVMGASAQEIAEDFGWSDNGATGRLAEWLHVLARSFGRLGDDGKTTTEIAENLIFGSVECNNMMDRYESNWRDLFTEAAHPKNGTKKRLKGRITGDKRHNEPDKLSAIDRVTLDVEGASWLCFILKCGLTFVDPPPCLGQVWEFSAVFYPFKRPQRLNFEKSLDKLLLKRLFSKDKSRTKVEPSKGGASATTSSRRPEAMSLGMALGGSIIHTEYTSLLGTASALMPLDLTVFSLTGNPSPDVSLSPMMALPQPAATRREAQVAPQRQQRPRQQPPAQPQPAQQEWLGQPPAQRPPAQTQPAQRPPAQPQPAQQEWLGQPPAQRPPAQTQPAQRPPAQTQPAQRPPAQPQPAQQPPAQREWLGQPPAQRPPAQPQPAQRPPAQQEWLGQPPPQRPPGRPQPARQEELRELREDVLRQELQQQLRQEQSSPGHTQPHREVWDHVCAGKSPVRLDGTPVHNPYFVGVDEDKEQLIDGHPSEVRTPSRGVARDVGPPSLPRDTPDGFLVKGDIKLFGLIPATLYSFQGTVGESSVDEMVKIPDGVSLGQVIPSLKNCVLDGIHLNSASFSYTKFYRRNTSPGLRFETDVVFEGQLRVVSDTLQTLFHQENPALHVSGLVGLERDWNSPLLPAGFTLSGSFERTSVKLGSLIEFTSVGVELIVSPAVEVYPRFRRYHKFSYGFFGSANITVPASVVPLSVNYHVQRDMGMYHIHLEAFDNDWKNMCGVEGLNVAEVQFDVSFATAAPTHSLSLGVRATIDIEHTPISLSGFYSPDHWGLQGIIEEVDLEVLGRLFQHMFGVELQEFTDHTITFSSLLLEVGTAGLTLAGTVTIDHYTSTKATISISQAGLLIQGSVADVELAFSDDDGLDVIRLDGASLNVFIGKNGGTGRSVKTVIEGKVSFAGISFSAGLYWKKDNTQRSQWTVYAAYGEELKLSELDSARDLEGTFLDLSIKHVAFLASSIDVSEGTFSENFKYPIKKGVRMCAMIDRIHEFNEISRSDQPDLMLSALYVSGGGLTIEVAVPTSNILSFGRTVTARSLMLGIKIARVPALVVRAEMSVKVPKRDSPLIFGFNLEAGIVEAHGSAEIKESWVNPLDISPMVTIGPNMALELGIIYTEFFGTGIPSQVGASGGLTIGNTTGTVAILLSENPEDELLSASIDEFGLDDLMDFASNIAGIEIHHPPQEMFRIHTVKLYISSGVTLGTTLYPRGVQFAASMDIFGKNASIDCKLGNELKITGSVDEFELGPLSVTGTGPNNRAILDLELGRNTQLLVVNGIVVFLEARLAIDVKVEFLPSPTFKFDVELDFNSLFKFTLQAEMDGEVHFQETSNLEFSLYALLDQHLLDYIATEAKNYFEKARKAAREGLDSACKHLEDARQSYKQAISQAQSDLDVAERAWTEKQREVHAAFDEASAATKEEFKELQEDVTRTEAAYYAALKAAKNNLKTARRDAAAAISEAQAGVRKAERDGIDAVEYHRRKVLEAEEDMKRQFGSALRALENARANVASKEDDLENAQRQLSNMRRHIDDAAWFEKPGLWIFETELQGEVGVAQGALFIAQGALIYAESIVEGPGYMNAQKAIVGYQFALSGAEATAKGTLESANGILEGVKITQDGAVTAAEATVTMVEYASEELRAFDAAREALKLASDRSVDVLGGLQASIDGLSSSLEFSTFDTARGVLDTAKHHTEFIDVARSALDVAQDTEEGAISMAECIVDAAAGAFQVTKIEMRGDLCEVVKNKQGLSVVVEGWIAEQPYQIELEFRFGDCVSFLKELFEKLVEFLKEYWLELAG